MPAKKSTKPTFELTVTKAVVKEYEELQFGYNYYYTGSYKTRPVYDQFLCVTGVDVNGKKFWVKFPKFVGVTLDKNSGNYLPQVAVGDVVKFNAKVKGTSDDGSMTFLNFAKLVAVLDAPEVELEVAA